MDEYIGKEALFAEFDRLGLGEHSIVEKVFSDGVRTIIAGMPAADVAPVVRCKDCKYNRGSKKCLNPDSFFAVPKDDDFCSYGERKDSGEHVE